MGVGRGGEEERRKRGRKRGEEGEVWFGGWSLNR